MLSAPSNNNFRSYIPKPILWVVYILLCCMLFYVLNEEIEHRVFKGATVHGYFNARSDQNIQLRNDDGDVSVVGMLAVFMHVPRTSGDSMKTHLFNDAVLDSSGETIWPNQYKTLSRLRPLQSFLTKKDLTTISSIESTRAVVKGFFSAQDLIKIKKAAPHREVKTIVFVRHPLERFLSFHAMVKPFVKLPNEAPYTLTAAEFVALVFNDAAMLENMPKKYHTDIWNRKNSWGCTFLNNALAWQLGYQQHCEARQDSQLSDTEVVERAKDTLKAADFVGFYETLDVDFPALRRDIFHDEYMNLDPLLYHIFSIGAHFSKPRLRVQKYLAAVPESEEMKARLERHLALDMEVYEWAKETYKPSLVLSSSWSEYMLYNPLFVFELAVLGVILYACCKAAFVTSKKATTAACGESTAGSLPRVLYIQEDISKI